MKSNIYYDVYHCIFGKKIFRLNFVCLFLIVLCLFSTSVNAYYYLASPGAPFYFYSAGQRCAGPAKQWMELNHRVPFSCSDHPVYGPGTANCTSPGYPIKEVPCSRSGPLCPSDQFLGVVSNTCRPKCNSGFYLSRSNTCKPLPACPANMSCVQPHDVNPDQGAPNTCSGNPINTASGNKYQIESDFIWGNGLSFSRFYNGSDRTEQGLGAGWRHNLLRRIMPVYASNYMSPPPNDVDPDWNIGLRPPSENPSHYLVEREDGKSFAFELNGQAKLISGANTYQLVVNPDGFIVKDGFNTETYDKSGKLLQVVAPNGYTISLIYNSDNLLSNVSDNLGNQLIFNYHDAFHVTSIQANGVTVATYSYDKGRLAKVIYADNTNRQYLYEDTRNPYLLTGLIDEAGQRYASWSYNDQGQAISSEHAGGVDKYSLNFGGDQTVGPRWTDETDPLGSVRRHNFKKVAGSWLLDGKNQPGGAGCSAATNGLTYDANGNIASRTDFNGNKTSYVYDLTRNLETSRTEAVGTPQVRTITTAWHPTWRLPATMTEPGQVTTYDYDAVTANLNSKTIAADGKTRVWTWTYFDKGLIKTATDPDGKVTSYTYDIAGNLATLTNPLSQITQFTHYDANGNLLEMSAADGIKTTLTYDARNRLNTRQTGTALTSYDYWSTGLLKQAALPNGQVINYTYDAAHRLTGVSDNRGNTVTYRLNNLGQTEQVDQNNHDGTLGVGLAQAQQLQVPANAVAKVQ